MYSLNFCFMILVHYSKVTGDRHIALKLSESIHFSYENNIICFPIYGYFIFIHASLHIFKNFILPFSLIQFIISTPILLQGKLFQATLLLFLLFQSCLYFGLDIPPPILRLLLHSFCSCLVQNGRTKLCNRNCKKLDKERK